MKTHKITITLLFTLLLGFASTFAWTQSTSLSQAQAEKLMLQLRSEYTNEVIAATHQFAKAEAAAIPYLQAGIADPDIRSYCVHTLNQIDPSLSAPVLIEALEEAPLKSYEDQFWFSYLVGAVGRTGDLSAVPLLQSRFDSLEDKEQLAGTSLTWALEALTEGSFDHERDPWQQAK